MCVASWYCLDQRFAQTWEISDAWSKEAITAATSVKQAEGFMGQPARSELETRLRGAFMAGKAATVRVGIALSNWKDPGPDALYPANTLRRLEMAARIQFGAGCSLLYEDWLA